MPPLASACIARALNDTVALAASPTASLTCSTPSAILPGVASIARSTPPLLAEPAFTEA